MKTKNLFFWLLLPFLALAISSCSKDSNSGSTPASNTPSVSIDEVTFDDGESEQIVTITLGKYKFYGAIVDEDGYGWCYVDILDEKATGKIKITTEPNTSTTPRSCRVNVWVANTDDPDDDEAVIMPIEVEQEAYKINVTEVLNEKFNFETEAHTDLIWTYDGGGHMEFPEMMYLWINSFPEDSMYFLQKHDTLYFWARQMWDNYQTSSHWFSDRKWELSMMITGFAEPFDNCKVDTVTYRYTSMGWDTNPDEYWQSDSTVHFAKLANIPLDNYTIDTYNKTGRLYFKYTNEYMIVIEGYDHPHSTTKTGDWQERNHEYVGSNRDLGEVDVRFKIR